MSELHSACGRVRHRLRAQNLVGRDIRCDLRLESHLVSSLHALLFWNGVCWSVKDLSSTNGTVVDTREVGARAVPIKDGSQLIFGRAETWVMVGDGAPPAFASSSGVAGASAPEVVESEGDRLLLPSYERAELSVFRDTSGQWCVESARDGTTLPATDQQEVEAGGRWWTLHLPDNRRTFEQDRRPRLSELTLHFTTRRGDEHVAIEGRSPRGNVKLGAYVPYYLLLVLARARLKDRAEGLDEAEEGWRLQQEVVEDLRCEPNELFGHTHRAKGYFAKSGVVEVAALVERRRDSQELRIGVGRLLVDEEARFVPRPAR